MDMGISGAFYWYSIGVFSIVFISGCIVNLLERHYIFQLAGIAFFFMFIISKAFFVLLDNPELSFKEFFIMSFPMLLGISACMISMVLGFWMFPDLRRKFKDQDRRL
jgi:hypothetical protein